MTPFFTEADCDVHADKYFDIDFRQNAWRDRTKCISLAKANRLLEERGRVVYGTAEEDGSLCGFTDTNFDDTRRAILIGIEEIEKDTAESLLRELWKAHDRVYADKNVRVATYGKILDRAQLGQCNHPDAFLYSDEHAKASCWECDWYAATKERDELKAEVERLKCLVNK